MMSQNSFTQKFKIYSMILWCFSLPAFVWKMFTSSFPSLLSLIFILILFPLCHKRVLLIGFQFCFGFALCLQIVSQFTHCTTLAAFSRPSIPMFIVCRNQTYNNRNQTEGLGCLHGYSLVKSNIYFFCFPSFPSPCLSPFRMILLGLGEEQRQDTCFACG